jgi:hypothetical protein
LFICFKVGFFGFDVLISLFHARVQHLIKKVVEIIILEKCGKFGWTRSMWNHWELLAPMWNHWGYNYIKWLEHHKEQLKKSLQTYGTTTRWTYWYHWEHF